MESQHKVDLTLENFPKIMQQYCDVFNKSKVMEEIIPRSFQAESDIRKFTTNLEYTKENNDLKSLSKVLSNPVYDLLDRGGKRWRPTLCMFVAEAFGSNFDFIKEVAGLCEIVHNGTLMIDDLEDNSKIRRNKPCVHLIYGNDIAVNAGNMMYYQPFLHLLKQSKFSDKQKLAFTQIYTEELVSLHLGQGWDILWHNRDKAEQYIPSVEQYLQMTAHKTGVLARLSTRLVCAALNVEEDKSKKIGQFAEQIGVAFQIQDDILNLEGEEYLKTKGQMGEDIHEGKMSLIVIHSLMNSKPADSKRLEQILEMHTEDQKLIDEAISIIRKSDSINQSRKMAEKIVINALNNIQFLEESDAKTKLQLLAYYVVGRKI